MVFIIMVNETLGQTYHPYSIFASKCVMIPFSSNLNIRTPSKLQQKIEWTVDTRQSAYKVRYILYTVEWFVFQQSFLSLKSRGL